MAVGKAAGDESSLFFQIARFLSLPPKTRTKAREEM
jgi:hypothetical protein